MDKRSESIVGAAGSHLQYGVILTDRRSKRFIIAVLNTEEQPAVFLREWVDDDFFEGDYYSLYYSALSMEDAEKILDLLEEEETVKARSLLSKKIELSEPYCEDMDAVMLADYIPDEWYDAWKVMETIITIDKPVTGYWEYDL